MILYNGLTLAYIGDSYYEMWIRDYCLSKGYTLVNDLHNMAIGYTGSVYQAIAAAALLNDFYTEEEIKIYKRGRNQNATHKPKNADVKTYNMSTGFEAVIGYLYLKKDFERLENILTFAVLAIEKETQKIV
ncbi:MAG: ribonuclease III domain-containing protein [Candidatus Izemoplasmatales bacterium]|jgi:ribonuclease-3 family protein|nr:ribonuclease III domain-containing protein [Candidatus Izemoplasmatales bacterium]